MNHAITFLKKLLIAALPGWVRLKTRYRCGVIVRGENRPGHGGRGLFLQGESLEPELAVLDAFLKEGDVFVDVGANVGAYTMKAAHLVGRSGIVIALEPFPRMAGVLLDNLLENHLENVRVRVTCASDSVGNQKFWMNGNRPNTFSLMPRAGAQCFDSATISIDAVASNEGLHKLSFLKVDAEGAENRILAGALRSIDKFRPMIMVEDSHETEPLIPRGYSAWKIPGSPNLLLFPEDPLYQSLPGKLRCQRWKGSHPRHAPSNASSP